MSFFYGCHVFRTICAGIGGSSIATISATVFANANSETTYPNYTLSDIQQHNTFEKRMWVSFNNKVYDITDLKHVGCETYLQLAAGGRLEPFWSIFTDHLKSKYTLNQLEKYRIGNLIQNDQQLFEHTSNENEYSLFADEPLTERPMHKLIPLKNRPFVAEAHNDLLTDSFFTPNELFYTRNHFPVPNLNETNYKLDIHINTGCDANFIEMCDYWNDINCDKSFNLSDIKNKFENIEIVCALQCCGNRGEEILQRFGSERKCCKSGFISNAKWKGVRIKDVLLYCGYNPTNERYKEYKFLTLYGYDSDLTTMHYAISIPINYVMNESNDCLLVFEMNGKTLPRDHGAPLRVLFPGIAGCRSVKWLGKIQLTKYKVDCEFQNRFYKPFGYDIYDMPVTSVISKYNVMDNGCIQLEGVAWSGGGRGIIKVEVSLDNGYTWNLCELKQVEQPIGKQYAWTLWNVECDVNDVGNGNNLRIMCRAMDTSFNSQPRHIDDVVNGTVYLNNAWHSVNVNLCK
eukprot:399163_1